MIVIVTTRAHNKTHKVTAQWPGMPRLRRRSYREILSRRSLPAATYIFTDFDRLTAWEVELAARLYRTLGAAGLRVLNDPARFRRRHAFLTRLHEAGINTFRSWSVEFDEMPDRYPVFLRTQAAHRGPLTGLLETADDARKALGDARAAGYVASDLHFVEYAAEPMANGVFRKMAAFRIGERTVQTNSVHSGDWVAKAGQSGVAGAQAYREELEMVETNPYHDQVMTAFETSEIDYGRADFVERAGRLEFFEINTNPNIEALRTHPFQERVDTHHRFRERYAAAMQALDTPGGGKRIPIDGDKFRIYRRRTARLPGAEIWTP